MNKLTHSLDQIVPKFFWVISQQKGQKNDFFGNLKINGVCGPLVLQQEINIDFENSVFVLRVEFFVTIHKHFNKIQNDVPIHKTIVYEFFKYFKYGPNIVIQPTLLVLKENSQNS